MGICEEFQHAITKRGRAWWCRPWDDTKDSCTKYTKGKRSETVKWRIRWMRTVCCCATEEVLDVLASISDSWARRVKAGAKHARRGDNDCTVIRCFPDHRVISSRQAAWLLGCLKGFEKERNKEVCTPRHGRKAGRAVAKGVRMPTRTSELERRPGCNDDSGREMNRVLGIVFMGYADVTGCCTLARRQNSPQPRSDVPALPSSLRLVAPRFVLSRFSIGEGQSVVYAPRFKWLLSKDYTAHRRGSSSR